MEDAPFTNRELERMFGDVHTKLDTIGSKLDYTNGKVRRLYLWLTVIGTSTLTLLATNGNDLIGFILKIAL